MNELSDNTNVAPASHHSTLTIFAQLLEILLTDASTDIEVVTREFGMQDVMRERLRRALDRIDCASGILEAMANDGRFLAGGEAAVSDCGTRAGLEKLAELWPQDYPEGQSSRCCSIKIVMLSARGLARFSLNLNAKQIHHAN
ncbi:hypothetical protein BZM27_10515 [Paraburkholderia steynii]|uniref:Uncharacterized protein n=1 Tax=Paraburkholderia steynii TaxID=1245441 RepID=A0A4R0XQ25_9BURK|nr:hypothetical protein BZM27_10515 [Paraburkholderia steynii]